jgi:hypothetical protein
MKAIAIPCFDRPGTVRRLLNSLTIANYDAEVALVFCVDHSGSNAVADVAKDFDWPHGPKVVHLHSQNIGLRKNIIFCGDLTSHYEAVVVLEDDSVVSQDFMRYVDATSDFYNDDSLVAQISLYAYDYDELCYDRFCPAHSGLDVYLMSWASSRGQFWTRRQWSQFRDWYDEHCDSSLEEFDIPAVVKRWPASSWKKYFIAFLADTKRYTLYPYHGYATNYGDTGENFRQNPQPLVQVQLAIEAPSSFRLCKGADIYVRYDAFFQPLPSFLNRLNPKLADFDYSVDCNASRNLEEISTPFLLSARDLSGEPVLQFGNGLLPVELNVLIDQEFRSLSLAPLEAFEGKVSFKTAVSVSSWNSRIFVSPGKDLKMAILRFGIMYLNKVAGSTTLRRIRSFFSRGT